MRLFRSAITWHPHSSGVPRKGKGKVELERAWNCCYVTSVVGAGRQAGRLDWTGAPSLTLAQF